MERGDGFGCRQCRYARLHHSKCEMVGWREIPRAARGRRGGRNGKFYLPEGTGRMPPMGSGTVPPSLKFNSWIVRSAPKSGVETHRPAIVPPYPPRFLAAEAPCSSFLNATTLYFTGGLLTPHRLHEVQSIEVCIRLLRTTCGGRANRTDWLISSSVSPNASPPTEFAATRKRIQINTLWMTCNGTWLENPDGVWLRRVSPRCDVWAKHPQHLELTRRISVIALQ